MKTAAAACYYFPNYHPGDRRNDTHKGRGWCEWELVKNARLRYPGHDQPKVPLWGCLDESEPAVMERKIEAAALHSIEAFIFDWYHYEDGPFLEAALDRGFLGAKNNRSIKFALMWANHDWTDIHPYRKGAPDKLLFPGRVSPAAFEKITAHAIEKYFTHPSYWRVMGNPYFSIYDLQKLAESFGSISETRKALDGFRDRAAKHGLSGVHLNAVVWENVILPGEKNPADPSQIVKSLGFDSVSSYVWVHHVRLPKMETDYDRVRDEYFKYWDRADKRFGAPYFPNVTMGWDSSPRAHQDDVFDGSRYPFSNTMGKNTPERFGEALRETVKRLAGRPAAERIFTINCWNEWTEGSYLEPDARRGNAYLEAVRSALAAPVK
jgi:hypothetical protein